MPKQLQERIDLIALLSLSDRVAFEFHLDDWINDAPGKEDQPVRPELEKLNGIKRLCLYGGEDENSACPHFAAMGVISEKRPGDHHVDEDYQGVAQRILAQLPALPVKP